MTESNRDLIQNREGLIELLYCLLLCSVLLEVPNDNDSQNIMCWGDSFDPLKAGDQGRKYFYLSLLIFAGGHS